MSVLLAWLPLVVQIAGSVLLFFAFNADVFPRFARIARWLGLGP